MASEGRPQNVPSGEDPASWAARKREGAGKQLEIMRKAAQKVLELLEKGDMSGARNAMVVGGIAVDKSGQLEEAAARHEEREARLSQAQAEAIAGALRAALDDLDLPRTSAIAEVVRHHLMRLEEPKNAERGPAPRADEARQDVRVKLREGLGPGLSRIKPIAELPPGQPHDEGEEAG